MAEHSLELAEDVGVLGRDSASLQYGDAEREGLSHFEVLGQVLLYDTGEHATPSCSSSHALLCVKVILTLCGERREVRSRLE